MAKELLERMKAHKALNLKIEQTPGSGYHDNDVDPTTLNLPLAAQRKIAPQHNGLPRLSEHVIAYYDHEYEEAVYFVGEDADKVLGALQSWCEQNKPNDPYDVIPGTHRKLLKHVPRQKIADGVLKVWLTDWNDFVYALQSEGIGITGAQLDPDGTTP